MNSKISILGFTLMILKLSSGFSQDALWADLEKEIVSLEKKGLAPTHPKILELKKQIQEKRVSEPPKVQEVKQSPTAYDFSAEVYGEHIQAIGVLVQIPPTADAVVAEEKIKNIFALMSLPEQRKRIISMHPAKLGVLVLLRPADGADFLAVFQKQKDFYGIQAGDPSKLYKWYCK